MLRDRQIKRAALLPLSIVLACLAAMPVYATCSSPAGNEGDRIYNQSYHTLQFCNGLYWYSFSGSGLASGGGGSGCSNPAGNEGDQIYNQAYHTHQFCNGTSWVAFGGALVSGGGGSGCSSPAGNEADQIYNKRYHTWQFCNGTNWVGASSPYVGPGDIVAGATAWFGLRGYSSTVASNGTQKAINIRRASDNATEDIYILKTGDLDVATAASFAGTDATATCSTSGSSTTLSCTGASSTPNVNDPISGAGITQPAYLTACGTFSGGTGSCTMNVAQTIVSPETVTFQVALFVTEVYDQTGNGYNATQSTATNQPQLLLTCFSTNPCISFKYRYLTATIPSLTQPYSMSLVFNQFGLAGTPNETITTTGTILETSTAGALRWIAGATGLCSVIVAGSSFAYQTLFNSTTSDCELNGTLVTGQNAGTNATGTALTFGIPTSGGTIADFYSPEFGLWPSDTHGSWTALTSNQRTYWSF